MVLLANVAMFSAIPAQVYGFASTVALSLLTAEGLNNLTSTSLANPVLVIVISMMVGAVFGYVSERLAGILAGAGSHRARAKA
jgi:hypothetical protein